MRVWEYAQFDATGLADLIRRRDVQASEVYWTALEAIATVNRHVNAVSEGAWEVPPQRSSGGTLCGVPITMMGVGEHVRGSVVRHGSRAAGLGLQASSTSELARQFAQMGLSITGLTTTPELGFGTTTKSVLHGPTRNPWNLRRSPGGPGGGTAALVAAGALPAGHVGGGPGAIQIPAACVGLVGLKPSRGRISYAPAGQEPMLGLAGDFVVTRTVRDSAAFLDGVGVPVSGDRYMIRPPDGAWTCEVGAPPGRLRIAVHTSSWSRDVRVDRRVAATVERVGQQLADLGHDVQLATPRVDWDEFVATQAVISAVWNAQYLQALVCKTGEQPTADVLEHATWASCERGRSVRALDLVRALDTVGQVARRVARFFETWDLLVTPTVNVPAPELGHLKADERTVEGEDLVRDTEAWVRRMYGWCSFAPLASWTGTPAMSLPLGSTVDGLPIGVQLAARMCDERTLLRVGAQLEEAMPWSARRPQVYVGKT